MCVHGLNTKNILPYERVCRTSLLFHNFEENFTDHLFVLKQEIMKVREVIPHTGPIPIVIPLNLFLDLLPDPVFPRGLTDSQSHVPIFTNVDS